MNPGIGPARHVDPDLFAQDAAEPIFELALNGTERRLAGEPVERASVIGEIEAQIHRQGYLLSVWFPSGTPPADASCGTVP